MDNERNKRLASIMGMCWHELPIQAPYHECIKCGRRMPWWNPDFSTPEWRARLMDFCVEQEWWEDFCESVEGRYHYEHSTIGCVTYAYLWRNLPSLLVEYHGEER